MAKYNIIKTSKLKFARFGGLSSVNQRGYDSHPSDFHSPPAHRGFYAFVWPYYELFLLGAPETDDPRIPGSKFSYVRDKNGNIITDKHPEYESLCEVARYWSINTSEWNKFFKNYPPYEDSEDIENDQQKEERRIKREKFYSDWDNTGFPRSVMVTRPHPRIFSYTGELWHHLGEYLKPHQILKRHGNWVKSSMSDYRIALEKDMHNARKESTSFSKKNTNLLNLLSSAKSPFRCYSKDHLEVFIEKL